MRPAFLAMLVLAARHAKTRRDLDVIGLIQKLMAEHEERRARRNERQQFLEMITQRFQANKISEEQTVNAVHEALLLKEIRPKCVRGLLRNLEAIKKYKWQDRAIGRIEDLLLPLENPPEEYDDGRFGPSCD